MSMFDNSNPGPQQPASFHSAPPGYSNAPLGSRPVQVGEKPWRARGLLVVALLVLAIIGLTYLL